MFDHAPQLLRALLVGGDLSLQVGDVLVGIAGRVLAAGQQRAQLGLAEAAALDELEVVDQHALFLDGRAVRRHGARGDAADVGVVAAAGDPEDLFWPSANTGVITVTSGICVPPL